MDQQNAFLGADGSQTLATFVTTYIIYLSPVLNHSLWCASQLSHECCSET